ncbi:MAG: acyl-CoA thioesterase [Muribaculaceae bacterium]|nr:acyl-CoA thioesterase [Muribaculaceae bacterium]
MFDTQDFVDGQILHHLPEPYTFGLVIKVRDYETDSQGIVNNANYLHYMEMTRHAFCEREGFSFKDMSEAGILAVLRRAEIDYLSSLHGAELFASLLWLERNGPKFLFHQDFYHIPSGEPVIKAVATVVASINGHLSRGDELAKSLHVSNP